MGLEQILSVPPSYLLLTNYFNYTELELSAQDQAADPPDSL